MHLPPPLAATGLAPCPLGLSGWQRPARVQRTPVSGSHAAIGLFRTDCRPGLQDESGICRKPQACGAARARPCPLTQRTPSCDRGLVEDFALNRCVPSEQSVLLRLADSALAEAQPLLKIAFGGLS